MKTTSSSQAAKQFAKNPVEKKFGPSDIDADYYHLENLIAKRIKGLKGTPLFTTDATGLWKAYLGGIAPRYRRGYNCHCCRRFIEKYGSLVTIDERGNATPAIWSYDGGCKMFNKGIQKIIAIVAAANVTGVFYDESVEWGRKEDGGWSHLHGDNPAVMARKLLSAEQVMAEKLEDYGMLKRGLEEFSRESVAQAVRVLEADVVENSEKTVGVATWLLFLHDRLRRHYSLQKDNLIWREVATAPAGYCHVKSTMIGSLLEDIASGLDFEAVRNRWNEKMHPLQYRRPTTLKQGTIDAANKTIETLNAEGALSRRFARISDVLKWEWTPGLPAGAYGIFDHLKPTRTEPKSLIIPHKGVVDRQTFERRIAPAARKIEFYVDSSLHGYFALTTAANKRSAAILQWDGLGAGVPRNPCSWYFYHGGSLGTNWNLRGNAWVAVNGICKRPPHWQQDFHNHQDSLFLILDGCRDLRYRNGALFFPDQLRNEYHGIRAAMEAFSNKATLAYAHLADACGVEAFAGTGRTITLRVNGEDVYTVEA